MGALDQAFVVAPSDVAHGVLARWLKQPGDHVALHEPVAEIETDKAVIELTAACDGVLTEVLVPQGSRFAAETVLARIAPGDEARAGATVAEPAISGERPNAPPRTSPAVRRALGRLGLAPRAGTGQDGRLTLADLAALAPQGPSTVRPLSTMRRQIAQRVVESLAAPQVTAVFQADFTAVLARRDRLRRENPEVARQWTVMPFVLAACHQAMAVAPEVNGRWTHEGVEVFENLNIGVITALGADGLVAPVVPRVGDLSFAELARTLAERIDLARERRLTGAEVAGGTFTISNHGASGSLLAAPVLLYQGQGAILGLGKVAPQVTVVSDGDGSRFEARPMAYVSLTIDHRFLDAAQTNAWLSRFVATLEAWPDDDRPEALWPLKEITP